MKTKILYTSAKGELDGMGREAIDPRLPSPQEMAKASKKVRITLNVSGESVDFFREAAKNVKIGYQQLMRGVLDAYANQMRRKMRKHHKPA